MILIQEKLTFDGDGGYRGVVWVDRAAVDNDQEAQQFIQNDERQREAYRLLPLDPQLPVREVAVEVVPTVRFKPGNHEFNFDDPAAG